MQSLGQFEDKQPALDNEKIIFMLLVVRLLTACTSQKEIMNSWLGSIKHKLILSWGPPARTASNVGTAEILIYAKPV